VRHLDNFARYLDVVFEGGWNLAVLHQGTIHHHAGKSHFDGRFAGGYAVAMIQMHHGGNFRIELAGCQHQVIEKQIIGIFASPAASLNNDWRFCLTRCFHNRLDLFHVVDIKRAHPISALGCLV
jgi:hypothetical protein